MKRPKTYAFLFLVSFLAYAPSLFNGFINFDDPFYVMSNPIFREQFWVNIFLSNQAGNWHPLTMMSHALDIWLFGLEPLWHHLINSVLHAITVILVYRWLRYLKNCHWSCLSLSLIWGLHPVQIQTVAWVSERKNILSMLFLILGLICWHHFQHQQQKKFLILTFMWFVLGLMSKVILVVFPVLLVLLTFHYQDKKLFEWPTIILKKTVNLWPFFLTSIVFGVLAIRLQGEAHAIGGLSWSGRIIGSGEALGSYFNMMVWPTKLAIMYPIDPSIQWSLFLQGMGFMSGLLTCILIWGRKYSNVIIGASWFVVTLIPTLGLIQVGQQSHADRYLYLPLLGLIVMALHLPQAKWFEKRIYKLFWLIPLLGLVFFVQTETRLWKSTTTIFTAAAERVPQNWYAHESLGVEYLNQHNPIAAQSHFESVLEFSPENASIMRYLVRVYLMINEPETAQKWLDQVDNLEPDYFETDFLWAKFYYQENLQEQAFARVQQVIEKAPYFGEGYELMVQILLQKEDPGEARRVAQVGFEKTGRESLKRFLDQFTEINPTQ